MDVHEVAMSILMSNGYKEPSFTLARWRVLDEIRSKSSLKAAQTLYQKSKIVLSDEENSLTEFANALISSTNLTHQQREILFLRFYKGLTVEQIAKDTKKSLSFVQDQLWLLIQTLKATARGMKGD